MDTLTDDKMLVQFGLVGSEATKRVHTLVTSMQQYLPLCTHAEDISGRWIARTDDVAGMFDRDPTIPRPVVPIGRGIGQTYFSNFSNIKWLPYNCRWLPATDAAGSGCLTNRRLLFHGDSQMRTLYNHVAETLCGVESAAVKGFLDEKCFNVSQNTVRWPACAGLRACFAPEAYGATSLTNIRDHDIFVTNFGQHACGKGRVLADHAISMTEYALQLLSQLQLPVHHANGRASNNDKEFGVHVSNQSVRACLYWILRFS